MENVLTISDVAKRLRLSSSTIYKYAEKGNIISYKVGNRWRFQEADIEKYLLSCTNSKKPKGGVL
jgi:excisionase family DNA binding protein